MILNIQVSAWYAGYLLRCTKFISRKGHQLWRAIVNMQLSDLGSQHPGTIYVQSSYVDHQDDTDRTVVLRQHYGNMLTEQGLTVAWMMKLIRTYLMTV